MTVSIQDVQKAADVIEGAVEKTPFRKSKTLSLLTGAEIYLKFENLQFTSSFKERGALTKLLSLSAAEQKAGVIAVSAGNHAQGVAYHAKRLGIPATIVMPKDTPYVKIRQTGHHGAQIILEGASLAESEIHAKRLAAQHGYTVVHPYDDDKVIAGQGTVALEMLEAEPALDDLIVPIGGGGLISGMATAAKSLKPDIRVIGVEAELYPSAFTQLNGGEPCGGGSTIAEGIAVKNVAQRTLQIIRERVDGIVLVSETLLERAVNLLLTIEKTLAEGAGAAGLAALLGNREVFAGRKVGLPICGGNIDPRLLASVLMRDMMREGRIARLDVDVADSPGQLAHVAQIIADFGCSIIEVYHQRLALDVSAKTTGLDVMIEAQDSAQVDRIMDRMRAEGLVVQRVHTH